MPRNHYICQAYLRGFASEGDCIQEMDFEGNIRCTTTSDVSYEEAPQEEGIEKIRKPTENWWGKFRDFPRTDLHLNSNRGQREKIAQFVANTIILTKMGRRFVRANTENHFNSKTELEAIKIGLAANQLKENFLRLKWLLVKPKFNLLTSDSPASWKMEDDRPHVVRAMFFPLTFIYLLCLSSNAENQGFIEDIQENDSSEKLSFASTCAVASNLMLIRGAREQNGKLYAPLGYDWDMALRVERLLP